jgi:uncharacterized protein (DUF1330 family)
MKFRRLDMIYAFAKLTVTNPDKMAAYREKAGEALSKHGGKVEAASGAVTTLDGNPSLPDIAALLSFPDADAAHAWINDPSLAEVHALRRGAGASDIVLLG